MAVDAYGITKLQPDMSGGMKWEPTNWATSRTFTQGNFDPNDTWVKATGVAFSCNISGGVMTWSGTNATSNPRIYVVNPDNTTQWRDVEVTAYFKVASVTTPVAASQPAYSGMEAVARTSHGWFASETVAKCDSRGIDARMRYDGHIDFEKETAHPDSTAVANKTQWTGGIIKDTWIGYKFLCYDLPNGNVKVELWMDTTDGASGGTWTKINEFTDDGTNMGGSTACAVGVDSKLRLTNAATRLGSESGIPNIAVYFRADNIGTNGMQYKRVSVREIDTSAVTPPATSLISFGALNPTTATIFGGLNDTAVVAQPTAPTAPALTVAGGDTKVTASWQVTSDGGSPITGWLVRIHAVGEAVPAGTPISDPNARTFVFSGLTNDADYIVEVAAVNAKGASTYTAAPASTALTPVLPGPVTGLTARPLDAGVLLDFTAPTNMGTGTLQSYQVTATDTVSGTIYLYSMTSLPSTLLGLPNDRQVAVEVKTVTDVGLSGGTTAFVTPTEHPALTTAPGSPTGDVVDVFNGALGLSWTAPASSGTYPINDYVIQLSGPDPVNPTRWYVTSSLSATVSGLTNGDLWTANIWARSAAGRSLVALTTTGTPLSSAPATSAGLPTYLVEPPLTNPDPNPLFWVGYLPPLPVGVSTPPDEPPPPPTPIPQPNIFAFYPVGMNESNGVFSPMNWAGE